MKKSRTTACMILGILILFLWSCSGGSGSASTESSSGTLSLTMVDAPGGSYQAVYVTIKEVQVCMQTGLCDQDEEEDDCACQWNTIAAPGQTYNLLELVNGVMATLGQKDLEAGTYNQMRLLLDDQPDDLAEHPYPQYLIDEEGAAHEMKVPSGYQTGIKLVHPFDIVARLTTELILDFDVARSVVKAGNSGKYLLKPTIKVIGTRNRAVVSGMVATDGLTAAPLPGATVTAWYEDAEGNWNEAMSSPTGEDGNYMLYLDLGGDVALDAREYRIVATADGFAPGCTTLTVEADQTYPDTDFILSPTGVVTVTGTVTGTAPVDDDEESFPEEAPVVTVSFSRQIGDCFPVPVETAYVRTTDDEDSSETVYTPADGAFRYTYGIELPSGSYDVTATSDGLAPQTVVGFDAGDTEAAYTLNFNFSD